MTTIISGLVVPRIIISCFGSEVNGLVTSITQFLNYISLLEGGVSGVVMASMYKPLAERNWEKLSAIFNAVNSFFVSIGKIYIIYLFLVAGIYPIFVKTGYSYIWVFILTLILGTNLFVQYFFSFSYKLLLNADRKVYFTSLVQIIAVVLNLFLVVFLARIFPNIHVIKLGSSIVFLLQPIAYHIYANRNYSLEKNVPKDDAAISQRWDGFGQNLAYFIHTNTDVIILTIFSTLANVSVYSVYFMVVNSLKGLTISIATGFNPSLGNVLVTEKKEKINQVIDKYEFLMGLITTFLFINAANLITPFVQIYTEGVGDANYFQPLFGILLVMAEAFYCFREPYIAVAYASGHFKQTRKYAYIEAVINLICSLCLVKTYGLIGIAIGTMSSMFYRMIAHVIYLKKNILYRPIKKFVHSFCINMFTAVIVICSFNYLFHREIMNWFDWIKAAFISCLYTCICYGIILFVFYRKYIKKLFVDRSNKK